MVLYRKWIADPGRTCHCKHIMKSIPFIRRALCANAGVRGGKPRWCSVECKGDGSAKEGSWPRGAGVAARSERWARVCLEVGLPAEWAALSQPARVRAPAPPRMRARTPQAIKLNTLTRSATTCAILARCRLTYIPRWALYIFFIIFGFDLYYLLIVYYNKGSYLCYRFVSTMNESRPRNKVYSQRGATSTKALTFDELFEKLGFFCTYLYSLFV